jgi:hypothetical protein
MDPTSKVGTVVLDIIRCLFWLSLVSFYLSLFAEHSGHLGVWVFVCLSYFILFSACTARSLLGLFWGGRGVFAYLGFFLLLPHWIFNEAPFFCCDERTF